MKVCKTCIQQFIPNKSYCRKKTQTFCSHTCQAKWAIIKANEVKTPKPKTGKFLSCHTCNKDFYVPKYRLKKECTKYCSRSCLAKIHLAKFETPFKPLNKPHHKYKSLYINGKKIYEHRYIMEQNLGRKLQTWEHVHHINDDSSDNRIENLEILSNSDHQRKEWEFRKKYLKTISSSSSNDHP